ncbi:uncharacterized protein LOC134839407 [Symsagittifera roscoffensis]|uniref:uncharacterized protein LOC134839407 n=1 Tax=Symsagittifera roscoffensis TaxID=84072 RepID=UPI00307B41D7
MKVFGSAEFLSAVILVLCCIQASMAKKHPRFKKREEVLTCQEECLHGSEKVQGLDHCYKMLVDLGPVSQDKAVAACGFEGGATVVTFDNPGDAQKLRDHFWDKNQDQILANPAYLDDGGFWTGYVRFFGNESNPFMNMYTGDPMDVKDFLSGQPDDRLLTKDSGEACVSRKEFHNEDLKWNGDQGLDDYSCAFPNWVICMHRNVYALNMEAWNSALMYGLSLPEDGTCQLDWTTQNYYQLTMMEEKRLAANTTHAHHLAENYLEILNNDAIKSPSCPQ